MRMRIISARCSTCGRGCKVPVYATPFTAALLEAKRRGEPGAPDIPVNVVPLGARFTLGPFDIELVSVAHSIPESNALIIRTPLGNVLHTGDWKLDPTPVIGPPTDEAKLRALGDEGCLALIGDSTNAVRDGRSPSETDVARTLAELITSAPRPRRGHDLRLQRRAHARGRRRGARPTARSWWSAAPWTASSGRARDRLSRRRAGFPARTVYGYLPPDKVVALCTGSQGEPRAALSRIAAGRASRGDAVARATA